MEASLARRDISLCGGVREEGDISGEKRDRMFFQGWETVFQTIVLSVMMYISIVVILRTSGKRTLATFNAFDFLITVAIGSISATTILSKTTTFVDGMAAIVTLVLLQYIVAKISAYSKTFRRIIKAEPTLLYYDGKYIEENLKKMRVHQDDILQEIRINSGVTIDKVHSVILEANGKLAVVTRGSEENLRDMVHYK